LERDGGISVPVRPHFNSQTDLRFFVPNEMLPGQGYLRGAVRVCVASDGRRGCNPTVLTISELAPTGRPTGEVALQYLAALEQQDQASALFDSSSAAGQVFREAWRKLLADTRSKIASAVRGEPQFIRTISPAGLRQFPLTMTGLSEFESFLVSSGQLTRQ